jgi:archaellum component FlaC
MSDQAQLEQLRERVKRLLVEVEYLRRDRDTYRDQWKQRGRDLNALYDKINELHELALVGAPRRTHKR